MALGAFFITGVPGSGKSTVARVLAQRFPRAAHIQGDKEGVWGMLVSGAVDWFSHPSEEAHRLLLLRVRNICMLADNFFSEGIPPIIDNVLSSREDLALFTDVLRARPLHLIVLAPRMDIVFERDANRHKQAARQWAHVDAEMQAKLKGSGLWIDSSDQSPDETVDVILARLDEAVVE